MKEEKVLLIIPAYNEEENIERVVNEITIGSFGYDYVVINDGSSDSTGKLCEKKGYNIINLPVNLGIGALCRLAINMPLNMVMI